jgi:hypothetical protein
MSYKPQMVSLSTNENIVRWVFNELTRVSNALTSEKSSTNTPVLHQEPSKPQVGDIVYADGTDWNPSSGAGLYLYTGNAWSRVDIPDTQAGANAIVTLLQDQLDTTEFLPALETRINLIDGADSLTGSVNKRIKEASNLDNYTTTIGMGTAISTALSDYTNTTGMNTAISTSISTALSDYKTWTQTLDALYPIGAIYLTVSSTFNPNTSFNGYWVQSVEGRTLVGVDSGDSDFNSARKAGGDKTHTLIENEMPSHSHNLRIPRDSYGTDDNYALYGTSGTDESVMEHNWSDVKGGGQPHNNMPPYFTTYIWERVDPNHWVLVDTVVSVNSSYSSFINITKGATTTINSGVTVTIN